jgi:hypothetical protein
MEKLAEVVHSLRNLDCIGAVNIGNGILLSFNINRDIFVESSCSLDAACVRGANPVL